MGPGFITVHLLVFLEMFLLLNSAFAPTTFDSISHRL